jgi:uncharacterized protein
VIFVDTSFWVALRNARDAHAAEALSLMRHHRQSGLVTSNHIRGETWTHLRRKSGHRSAVDFLDRIAAAANLRVHVVGAEREAEALTWLRRHDEREYSFVDATSFVLMRSLGIDEALAFDGDFAAAGFVELRA